MLAGARFCHTYNKIGTIQRRLAWPLCKDDMQICEAFHILGASLVAQMVKNPPAMGETWVWSLGWEDPLEKGKGYPLQYSGLENSMDCIVHGVAKSWTWPSDFFFFFNVTCCMLCDTRSSSWDIFCVENVPVSNRSPWKDSYPSTRSNPTTCPQAFSLAVHWWELWWDTTLLGNLSIN